MKQRNLFTLALVIILIFSFAACSNADPKEATKEPEKEITLSIAPEVWDAGIGAWDLDLERGDPLDKFIEENEFKSAIWEKDGTLTITLLESVRDKELKSEHDWLDERFSDFADEKSGDYVYYYYNYKLTDNLSTLGVYVNGDAYMNDSFTDKLKLQVLAEYEMSLLQVYTDGGKYGFVILYVDYESDEVVDYTYWPSFKYVQAHPRPDK